MNKDNQYHSDPYKAMQEQADEIERCPVCHNMNIALQCNLCGYIIKDHSQFFKDGKSPSDKLEEALREIEEDLRTGKMFLFK